MKETIEGRRPLRILVIDDEPLITMLTKEMIADLGHLFAGSAVCLAEALSAARTADFDLAILDINLRGALIYPVAEVVRARGLRMIFATGRGGDEIPDKLSSTVILTKPFDQEDLEEAIQRALTTQA